MVSGQIIDTISNIKTVKQFAHISHENDAAVSAMDKYLDRSIDRQKTMLEFRIVLLTLAGLIPVGLVGLSLLSWVNNLATVGEVTIAGAIALRLAQMTGWVSFTLMNIYAQIGEIEDGIKTLTPRYTLKDQERAKKLNIIKPKIKIEKLKFKYGREIGGITDLSLDVSAGEKIGLVGASGAGKSTLVNLILRFYDAEGGRILISDQDIAEITQDSLRSKISVVAQDTSMFNRSAYDNILYGNPVASPDDVMNAAKKAQAHQFIMDLTDNQGRSGFDAHLGERGVKLSGGQRQRIALARAILKNAPILILDEATSALDSETEAEIQHALDYVMRDKTVIAIAHRLSTIVKMDRIILLHEGKIVEQGTHNELLTLGGLYSKYWERQSGGFIGIDKIAV
jgi:ATP-binding cassette subfamily B protein